MATPTALVSVDQVIATANSIIEGADQIDRAYFKEWIYLGLGELGPNTAWIGNCTLYPNNLELKKPTDMYAPIDIGLFDSYGRELHYTYRGLGQRVNLSGNNNLDTGVYAPEFGAPVDLSEDQYYFYLGSNSTLVSYALIRYLKYPVDETGNLLIPESDVLVLAYFVKYMWYCRKDDKQGMGQWNAKWIAARNEARANHKVPSELQGTQIARTWNSMIQKLRFKTF